MRAPGTPHTDEADTQPAGEPVARGTSFGRYLVLERLGAGGMGVVYAAYDPELNRKLALKLLRAGSTITSPEVWRHFVMREARAMARLTHPNVLPVHDVGTHEGQVFIALDLLDGGTLRDWLGQKTRGWREVLEKFRLAGEGLRAAHAAGLVHRDFKPDNVLLGKDGRVCVTDFGLVRSTSRRGEEVTSPGDSPEERAARPAGSVGTPAYMAPELLTTGEGDARSDQFSYCVALYEALYGEPPFRGETVADRARAILKGEVVGARPEVKVPAGLRRAIIRGLKAKPEQRWPSMVELLGELDRVASKRQRGLFYAGAGLAILMPGIIAGAVVHHQRGVCRGAETHLTGVWDDARKQDLHAALSRTGRSFAEASWIGVERALDTYAAGWVQMRTEACEATRVRGEQSDAVLTARMACLDERLAALKGLETLLAAESDPLLEHAVESAHQLPPLSSCADLKALAAGMTPMSAANRAAVEGARAQLVDARIQLSAARYEQGLAIAEQVARAAKDLSSPPLAAEAEEVIGRLQARLGRYLDADHTLERAAREADEAQADRIRASALNERVVVAGRLARNKEAESYALDAQAALARAGRDDGLEAERLNNLGRVLRYMGRLAEAEELIRHAVTLEEQVHGHDDPQVAEALNSLSVVLVDAKRFAEALVAAQESLAIRERLLGPDHPAVADSLINLNNALRNAGRFAEGHQAGVRAVQINERAFGPDHPHLATALATLGATETEEGQYEAAREHLNRAIAIRQKAFGADSAGVAMAVANLAALEARQQHWSAAVREWERVATAREKALGPHHPLLADALDHWAAALDQLGRAGDSAQVRERAVQARAKPKD